jgi:hypothetical protein
MVQTMNNVLTRAVRNSGLAGGGFSHTILALVLLGAVAVSPALATTYQFTIPVGTQASPNPNSLLGALAGAINFVGDTPTDFAFYDFYIRPQLASDAGNGLLTEPTPFTIIPDYSMSASKVTAPVPGCSPAPCTATYDATPNLIEPGPWLGNAAHFRFNPLDNVIALVTENLSAGGKNYNGQPLVNPFPGGASTRTEIMPSAATFAFTLDTSAYSSLQTPQITFQVYALAIQYSNAGATLLAAKDSFFVGNFDAVGAEVPEPSTIFAAGCGLCILALARFQRKVKH